MIEQVYPSGRVVKNTLDADGQLQQVQSRRNTDASLRNYANAFNYTVAGAVSAMRLGNGLWETTQFNSRLQPVMIGLGTGTAVQNRLRLDYAYGELQSNGTIDASKNNGNLTRQTITVPTVITGGTTHTGFTAVQSYQYDSLNRLKSAVENVQSLNSSNQPVGSQSLSWRQTFTFDRYGNRRFDTSLDGNGQPNTTTLPANCPVEVCNPEINPQNNRLSSPGWQYDAAGNTIRDAENRRFTYDGENKQVKVEAVDTNGNSTGIIGKYYFDGNGKRMKKIVPPGANGSPGETTVFVYDASNKLVAEYSTIVEPQSTAKINYLTQDHLGSPRILTDVNGNTISRRDFMPFGEEIFSPQRTQSLGYTTDTLRRKFTTYERDAETDLDFAQARMYQNHHGRFTTVDPVMLLPSAAPQYWNKYSYCTNNPLVFYDESGLWPTHVHDAIIKAAFPGLSHIQIHKIQVGSYSVDFPGTVFSRNAPQHAMRAKGQTVEQARAEMQNFIRGNIRMASTLNTSGTSPSLNSLFYFGRASHPVMDDTSPAHNPFQEYDDSGLLNCNVDPIGCGIYLAEAVKHARRESKPTKEQFNRAVDALRRLYTETYGPDALARAVGGYSNYFVYLPVQNGTLRAGKLGVVTVNARGEQKYDGPLKGFKPGRRIDREKEDKPQ